MGFRLAVLLSPLTKNLSYTAPLPTFLKSTAVDCSSTADCIDTLEVVDLPQAGQYCAQLSGMTFAGGRVADYFYEKGWLYPGSQVYPYLAHLGPLTSVCNFMENSAIKLDEFDHLNNDFRRYLSKYVDIREFQHLQQYPLSIKLNCAAVASHSVLFGPDGAMYKCSHEVGVHAKSHDHVSAKRTEAKSHSLPVLSGDPNSSSGSGKSGAYDYLSYDPFSHPTCSKCRYLPVCMGGCPKMQFEKNQYYIEGCQRFWQNSFEPMIRTFADAILGGGIPLDHSVQEVEKEIDVFGI